MAEQEMKGILKEALKEWLDEKFSTFGKWSLATISALILGAITIFILNTNGWHQ